MRKPGNFRRNITPAESNVKSEPTLDDAKKLLDTSATANRNLFLAFLAFEIAALMLCLGVGDEQLLMGTTPVSLAFLNLTLPIPAFAIIAPFVLLLVHCELLHNLNEHANKLRVWLGAWDSKYPADPGDPSNQGQASDDANNTAENAADTSAAEDGGASLIGVMRGWIARQKKRIAQWLARINPLYSAQSEEQTKGVVATNQLFPFLYDFAFVYSTQDERKLNGSLLPTLCWNLYCWAPFTVLVIFLIRFADLQEYSYVLWHSAILVFDIVWIMIYWPKFKKRKNKLNVKEKFGIALSWLPMLVTMVAAAWTIGLFSLIQYYLDSDGDALWAKEKIDWAIEKERKLKEKNPVITLVPRITVANFEVKVEPNHFDMARVTHGPKTTPADLWPYTARPINLFKRRLGFANFTDTVLPRANFSGAILDGSNMLHAQLQGANFSHASLRGASLIGVQLQGARMDFVNMESADLHLAQLKDAILNDANLQGASLNYALLDGADLTQAKLNGAFFVGAQMVGTNMRVVELKGASLDGAQMVGADLTWAQLNGASLWHTQLQGAILNGSQFAGAQVDRTQLLGIVPPSAVEWLATSGTPDLEKRPYLSSLVKGMCGKGGLVDSSKDLCKTNERIGQAPLLILPAQDQNKFTNAWLSVLCSSDFTAQSMLRRIPAPVSHSDLQRWVEREPKCRKYREWVK